MAAKLAANSFIALCQNHIRTHTQRKRQQSTTTTVMAWVSHIIQNTPILDNQPPQCRGLHVMSQSLSQSLSVSFDLYNKLHFGCV